jgi:hypothetical protein
LPLGPQNLWKKIQGARFSRYAQSFIKRRGRLAELAAVQVSTRKDAKKEWKSH